MGRANIPSDTLYYVRRTDVASRQVAEPFGISLDRLATGQPEAIALSPAARRSGVVWGSA